jgi:hypothetical protein
MTLVISKGITLRKGYIGTDDPDAEAYIAAVEAADEAESPGVGALETATKVAIHSFVKGCKADGIWPAIKVSCILAGARTLTGALVPLVGTAPTNVGGLFVSGDYDRKTGLVGNGSTKYLDSNRNNNADPQNNNHNAVYVSTAHTGTVVGQYIGTGNIDAGRNNLGHNPVVPESFARSRTNNSTNLAGTAIGFLGHARSNSNNFILRGNSVNLTASATSATAENASIDVFRRGGGSYANARLAFYSIGESLDLALLDARVTDLINAFGAAIP